MSFCSKFCVLVCVGARSFVAENRSNCSSSHIRCMNLNHLRVSHQLPASPSAMMIVDSSRKTSSESSIINGGNRVDAESWLSGRILDLEQVVPDDCIQRILSFLQFQDVIQATTTSKNWLRHCTRHLDSCHRCSPSNSSYSTFNIQTVSCFFFFSQVSLQTERHGYRVWCGPRNLKSS